jgi:hypothetical protein
MATSVHLPPPLLQAIDRKARALKISRNRLIVQALEREVEAQPWSPGFFNKLGAIEPGDGEALDASLATVRGRRRSKAPVAL